MIDMVVVMIDIVVVMIDIAGVMDRVVIEMVIMRWWTKR